MIAFAVGFNGEYFYLTTADGKMIARRADPGTDEWKAGLWISVEPGYRVFEKRNKRGDQMVIEYDPPRLAS